MSTALHASLLTTEERLKLDRECSSCGLIANFACIDHCEAVLCARCTSKHRANVIRQMHELFKRLKMYQMRLADSTDNLTDSNLSVMARNSLETYLIILKEHLEKDHLLDAKTLFDLDMRLNDQIGQITKKSPSLMASHNFRRSHMRAQTARNNRPKTITVSLNIQKDFPLPIERSFSMGPHPIAVSLVDSYLETVFCQGRDNSVILLSLLSIDVYTRGSGLTWSIPLSRVLGNIKDKIFAGVWCSYVERLILVGRYHFYMFDIDRQRVRCVCKCGCGARCCSGTMPPTSRRYMTIRYRCQPTYDDRTDSRRFLASNHTGLLFYAYKSGADTYRLETYTLDDVDQELKLINDLSIDGQLAAICLSYDHLAFVYRRFPRIEKSTTQLRNLLEIDHYFALHNHSLKKLADHVRLPSSIRWITAIVSYGTESKYLLCDPRSQQLLLYQAIDGVLIRRFHIGPVNACCLSDGRLVLWIQKAYASSPIGKLHFISTPHLEKYALVSTSFELLKKSHK
ncbi:unnamed protein product [Rotaria sp. Silwood1]|nr:unnamed protein product [Rotaria sp. Silwood1]CAF1289012.1 unnamed protein product [Rotaria sp. Silwood1]CAF3526752.1 unnamed protein product [Rotaria sp. Silwood1]CAF3555047.1 unnamed protein product [Rotaria sp. Silwood1]CAF4708881.1 unnamed protein product [Rotaria sp. Silwood1]